MTTFPPPPHQLTKVKFPHPMFGLHPAQKSTKMLICPYKAAKYPKFYQRLKKKTIKEIEVKGDCCWELYPRKQYNGVGRSVTLKSGHHKAEVLNKMPNKKPKSIKKTSCF